jgi:hypothetical protein
MAELLKMSITLKYTGMEILKDLKLFGMKESPPITI